MTPHPLNDLTPDQVKELARACYPIVLRQLAGHAESPRDDFADFVHPAARAQQVKQPGGAA